MAYKKLIKVSDVCQLLDKSKYPATQTRLGITWTNNGDGTITANGTCTAEYYSGYIVEDKLKNKMLIGHKYALFAGNSLATYHPAEVVLMFYPRSDGKLFSTISVEHVDGKVGWVLPEGSYSSYSKVELRIRSGATVENFVFKPQLFDLTEMYGAGHEPTTVEQFRQDFPEEMYDYSPYCWLTSYKRVIVTGAGNYLTSYQRNLTCKTKNLLDINSVTDIKHVSTDTILPHTLWSIKNNSLITKVNYYDNGACIFLPTLNLEPGTYTLSAYCVSNHPRCFVGIRDFNKSKWFHEAYNTNTQIEYKFEITEKSEIGLMLQGLNSNLIVTFSNIQLELGSTATDYVPYGYL